MAGPNLEVFKFGLYLFFPLAAMVHFGKPEWYTKNVLPYRDHLFPAHENTRAEVPVERTEIREHLARMKSERIAKRQAEATTKPTQEERLV